MTVKSTDKERFSHIHAFTHHAATAAVAITFQTKDSIVCEREGER